MLSKQEIKEAFMNAFLEENYNFLEEDLIKLANAFVKKARPIIAREELANCAEVVIALNSAVGNKLLNVRIPAINQMSEEK